MVGGVDDVALGVSPVEGIAGAGALMSVGISTSYGSSGCSGCGISGWFGPAGTPSSTS